MTVISVDRLNTTFPHYPRTVEDKGWIYGVWYCGTAWQKAKLHGEYPSTFLKRALALFPTATMILHAPSGTVRQHISMDRIVDTVRRPIVQADCAALPFHDVVFDLVLSDPPHTVKDATIYGCPPFPMKRFMGEARRVLRPDGYLGILHTSYPSYSRKEWALVGLIAVVTGFVRATRMFSIFQVRQL